MTKPIQFAPLLSLYVTGFDYGTFSQTQASQWQTLIRQIHQLQPPLTALRLVSGYSAGAEQAAVACAHSLNAEIHLLIEHKFNDTPGLAEAETAFNIQRIISLGRHTSEKHLTPSPLCKRHEIALNFTDLILCYWDETHDHFDNAAQSRLLRQAALSRKPVIWLNPQGLIRWLDLSKLDDARLILLDSTHDSLDLLLGCFISISDLENTPLKAYLSQLFDPSQIKTDSNAKRLSELIDDEIAPSRFHDTGHLHEIFSALLHSQPTHLWQKLTRRQNTTAVWHATHQDIQPKPSLIDAFNRHDLLANQAGGLHRSNIWLLYGFSALAVFIAVGAEIWNLHWLAFVELGLIASIIYRVWWSRKVNLHEKWISHRFLAEQMRYCLLGYPILAIPNAFRQPIWQITNQGHLQLNSAELWLLQRHLITTGIPCEDEKIYTPPYHNHALAAHIQAGVQSQMRYHQQHHHQKHLGHHRLHTIAQATFVLTFIAVVAHLYIHEIWLLLFTAALPASAAAIHGILTKLEMERISGQSAGLYHQMEQYDIALTRYIAHTQQGNDDWKEWVSLHNVANASQQTMSDNITQWQHLIQKQQTEIPA